MHLSGGQQCGPGMCWRKPAVVPVTDSTSLRCSREVLDGGARSTIGDDMNRNEFATVTVFDIYLVRAIGT
jgi:hypothetical protein